MVKKLNYKQTESGEIPEVNLQSNCNLIQYGYTESATLEKVGPKFLRGTDIKTGRIDWDTVPYCRINDSDYKKYKLNLGDIVITRMGSPGDSAIIEKNIDAVFASYLIRIKVNDIFDQKYVFYFLQSNKYKSYIESIVSTSVQPGANAKQLTNVMIRCPDRANQQRIAKILSDLDEKIELNRQMNKTLESIAQAIFKRWFVDFEFLDRSGKLYRSSGGKMVDSELGEIPDGWQIKEIKDCGEVICGKTPPTADKENYGDDIFFITIPDMRNQAFVIKTERKLSKRGASLQKNKELSPLTICVSCIATPGLVSITSDISYTNQQINSIVCKKDVSPYFMYYTMLDKSEEIKTMGLGGTATLNLNTRNFARIKVIIPDHITMDAFHKKVAPIMSRLLSNLQENIKLCDIRDSFLPRLMSGKMRVKN